jgi:hypothetical protein
MPKSNTPLRILQSVATLTGASDSLESINTTLVMDRGIVAVVASNALYMLRRDSVASASSPNIIAPAQGGPGRWYLYSSGPTFFADVSVAHNQIPPQSSVDAAFTIPGADTTDVVEYNLTDSGLPAGIGTGPVRMTGAAAATMRFLNATATTSPTASVGFRMAVLKD